MQEDIVFKDSPKRFWVFLVPALVGYSIVLFRFSRWGLAVFSPKADMPLRLAVGYLPLLVVPICFVLVFLVYWRYLDLLFEFTPDSLVLKHRGQRYEFSWNDLQVTECRRYCEFRDLQRRVVVHRAFFDGLPRLCEMVREARRYKRKDWGVGPA